MRGCSSACPALPTKKVPELPLDVPETDNISIASVISSSLMKSTTQLESCASIKSCSTPGFSGSPSLSLGREGAVLGRLRFETFLTIVVGGVRPGAIESTSGWGERVTGGAEGCLARPADKVMWCDFGSVCR